MVLKGEQNNGKFNNIGCRHEIKMNSMLLTKLITYFRYAATIFIICLSVTNQLSSQWILQNQQFSSGSVHFADSKFGLALDAYGSRVVRTTDTGESWQFMPSKIDGIGFDIFPVTRNEGYVVGENGLIAKTTDGGISWNNQESGIISRLNSVFFINSEIGWIAGDNGVILHTTNGGQQWNLQNSGTSNTLGNSFNNALYFLDSSTGWIIGYGNIVLTTIDGGSHWISNSISGNTYLNVVYFTDKKHGWVGGGEYQSGFLTNTLNRTTDGGLSWTKISLGSSGMGIGALSFADTSTGWVSNGGNHIVKTTDAGNTWVYTNLGYSGLNISSIQFLKPSTLIVNHGYIYKSTDQGENWNLSLFATGSNFHQIIATDTLNGWAVGSEGIILHTSNGGEKWLPQSSTTTDELFSICFVDKSTGWAVGGRLGSNNGYTILKTTDAGASWSIQKQGSNYWLTSVHFIDANYGWAVGGSGGSGKLLATTNGGVDWRLSLLSPNLYKTQFVDHSTGYGIDGAISIRKTLDGGKNWFTCGWTDKYSRSLFFIDANTGWVVGDSGMIWKTTNGGDIWGPQWSGTSQSLSGIHFYDHSHGWICGTQGFIAKTSDGGATWVAEKSNTTANLLSLYASSDDICWAAGENGLILRNKTADAALINGNTEIAQPNFNLYQNYPNPFNPVTFISFSIAAQSNVSLKIFDVLGKEVTTIFNDKLGSGYYTREWNAIGHPSGIYFYRLQAGSYAETKKLILLK